MPIHDAERAPDPAHGMSRRSLLQGAATAGAAGLAVTGLATTGLAAAASPALAAASKPAANRPAGPEDAPDHAEPIVVHVRDARSGDIEVFAGTRQARLRDEDLAARLARTVR